LALAAARPETEMAKDVWDLRVFGRAGRRLHFGQVTQAWLAEGGQAVGLRAPQHRRGLRPSRAGRPISRPVLGLLVPSPPRRRHQPGRSLAL
jgi:hypothetical protein